VGQRQHGVTEFDPVLRLPPCYDGGAQRLQMTTVPPFKATKGGLASPPRPGYAARARNDRAAVRWPAWLWAHGAVLVELDAVEIGPKHCPGPGQS
jgi:hypothetical protein